MSARTPSARTPSVRTPSASSLSVEQRAAQTFAVYRTGSPTSFGNGWPGCVGAVKQPTGASPRDARRLRNSIQRTVMAACGRADSSSSAGGDGGIPALFFQEALHGAEGDTIFPSPAALGSSWEPSLLEQVLTTVAASARALGSHAVLAPVLDLFVDPRFGRLQEGFGEDPMHVAAFARAAAIGLQGAPPADDAAAGGSSSNPKMASRSSSTRRHGEDQSAGDGGPTSRGHHGGNANGDGRRAAGHTLPHAGQHPVLRAAAAQP